MAYLRFEISEVVEARMRARWRLGQLLVKIDRGHGPGRGRNEGGDHPSFKSSIATLAQQSRLGCFGPGFC